jgi:hypothetical protein
MDSDPTGPEAARLRQRKFALLRQFPLPHDPLPGSLSVSYTRWGKPTCHCAKGEKHPAWSLTGDSPENDHRSPLKPITILR